VIVYKFIMMNLHLFIPALVCGFMGRLGMQAYKPG